MLYNLVLISKAINADSQSFKLDLLTIGATAAQTQNVLLLLSISIPRGFKL